MEGKAHGMAAYLARALSEVIGPEHDVREQIIAAVSEENYSFEIELPGCQWWACKTPRRRSSTYSPIVPRNSISRKVRCFCPR